MSRLSQGKYDQRPAGQRCAGGSAPSAVGVIRAILAAPPRRPVRIADLWPLGLFLIAYGLVCLWLELADKVLFVSPWAFALMLIAPWFWWMHAAGYSGLRGDRAIMALLVRLSLFGLLVAMIAEPRSVQKNEKLVVMMVMDVSASVSHESKRETLKVLARIASTKPASDEVGMVLAAREAAVEHAPSMAPPGEFTTTATGVDSDGTNLAKALRLASAMIPESTEGRIVLATDGAATEGSLPSVLDELRSRSIAVDVLPIHHMETKNEVWVERLELPRFVRAGDTYEAKVIYSALKTGRGVLVLEENGQRIAERPVEFQAGKNNEPIPIYRREPGYYEYAVTLEVPEGEDGVMRNNKAVSFLYLQGDGKVLVVRDSEGNQEDWRSMVEAMRQAKRSVEVIDSYQLPRNSMALLPYDCLVLANVAVDMFDTVQLQAVHDAVRNQGTGLLMVGGENSFGPGGYHRTPIEEALPVTMDIKQHRILPKGALVIVLHTCEFPQGNTWAKRITKQAIKVLSDQDEAGVLAYDSMGKDRWIVPMMPVSKFNTMATLINQAQIGDMPSFGPTMEMGYLALAKSNAMAKHMIIISDGDPSAAAPGLLEKFVKAKITISTVSVFPHGNTLVLMKGIAKTTGGTHHNPQNPNQLPSIFIKEAKTLRRSMIQEVHGGFVPEISFPSSIVKGIDAMPPLYGYVITTPKPHPAVSVMEVPKTEDRDPLLARWNYGVGRSVAFTSDLSPLWGADWVNWGQYQAFVKQLITDVSRVRRLGTLRIQSFASGTQGVVIVEDHSENPIFLNLTAQVDGPHDQRREVRLKQTGPSRYEGRFPLWGVGRYQASVTAMHSTERSEPEQEDQDAAPPSPDQEVENESVQTERVHAGFAVPYSQEHMRFRGDPITLERIREATGGRNLKADVTGEEIYDVERVIRKSDKSMADWMPLWIFLLSLLLLDVAMRRVHLDWAMMAAWFRTRQTSSEKTMDALLRRKKTVALAMQQRTDELPSDPLTGAQAEAGKTERPKPKGKIKPAAQEDALTTSRLLAMKRKRETEDKR